jgi:lipopolysaccharide export system permease protein
LPISALFAVSFTLGSFYANNELIAVFGAGVSLYRFVLPLLFLALLLSVGLFFFEEHVVIETFKKKNQLSQELLNQKTSFSNTNVTVISTDHRIVYHADYYNDNSQTLSGVLIVARDANGRFLYRLDAERAEWEKGQWKFPSCRLFSWSPKGENLTEEHYVNYIQENLNEPPRTFQKNVRNIEEMHLQDAREWILSLKKSGLPYRKALTEYYQRFSFA